MHNIICISICMYIVKVSNLEHELEETRERAALFDQEVEEQSQGQDMQLLDSQV